MDLKSEVSDRLDLATSDQLQLTLNTCLNLYDESDGEMSDLNQSLFDFVINAIERDDDGRLIAPALWDSNVEHLLARNFQLANKVLQSTIKKLGNNREALDKYDSVIKEQLEEGIICKIEDINSFLNDNPDVSFLPHSAVIREGSQTTKLRVVFLSNLCKKAGGV